MEMADFCPVPYSLIPLSSAEPLWEWDIVTDAFFLTQGALKRLNLSARPRSMAEFYSMLQPDVAGELSALHEGVISGKTGSMVECGYIFNGLWVEEHALALIRNSEGRATRLMGKIDITTMQKRMGFQGAKDIFPDAGLWCCDVRRGLVWRDQSCDKILRLEERKYPLSLQETVVEVHPAEKDALKRHYELFFEGDFLGDAITDIVRLKIGDEEYLPALMRATAVQRDDEGRAMLICGLLAPLEPQLAGRMLNNDDRLFHAISNMGSGHWNWDTRQDRVYFGPNYLAILGYSAEDDTSFSEHWRGYIHPDDLEKVEEAQRVIVASPKHGDSYECTYRIRRADGGWAWILDRACVTWRDMEGRAGHLIGSITNITTAQEERDKLEEQVRHDTLTGLRSRAFCKLEIEHIEQNEIRPVTVISVDITGLKMVNDYLGHARGDELLTAAATLMRSSLRRSDCIGRIGGDEFLILLPGCDDGKGRKVLKKLATAFDAYNRDHHSSLPVFAAMGMASAANMEQSVSELMARADEEMYRNKKRDRQIAHAALKAIIKARTGREVGADERL